MHVMQIVSGGRPNGAVIHALMLSRELAARGHRVTLLCRPESWIAEKVAGDPIHVIRSDLHRWPLDELRRVAGYVRTSGVGLVHTHMSRAHMFGVLLRRLYDVPCVATAHNRYMQFHWMWNDFVIANSDATRRFHIRRNLVAPRRIETIYYFLDLARLTAGDAASDADARRRVRQRFGVSDSTPVAGVIGDITPRKGHLYLVRALPRVVAALPDVRLAVIGDARGRNRTYAERVQNEARRLGVADHILWTGYSDNVPETLRGLDLCICAPLEEPFGLTAPEAMAAQVPVVATAVGGLPESVVPGETGELVRPKKPRPLAEAIIRLLGDATLRQQYGRAGRQRVCRLFAPETQLPRIEAVYERFARVSHRAVSRAA